MDEHSERLVIIAGFVFTAVILFAFWFFVFKGAFWFAELIW